MTKSRGIRAKSKPWSTEDDACLRRVYPDTLASEVAAQLGRTPSAVHARATKLGVHKSEAFLRGPMAQRLDSHRHHGQRFQPGSKPWSTGTKGVAGVQEGCKATQFKKGQIVGRNAERFIDVGGHRVNGEGYLDRKLRNDGPPHLRWERVHRLVWIEAHGPIPENHVVVFRGARTTVLEEITVDRLECITRAEVTARLRAQMSPEFKQVVQLRGQITRQINKRLKEQAA